MPKLSICIFLCFLSWNGYAQNDADDYYRAGQFAQAAKMFEKQLEKKNNWNTKSKLANCYRMTSRHEQAFQLYAELVQQERTKADNYFHFAEMLMQKEQYDSAKIWLERYLAAAPKDELGSQKLLQNLSTIKSITPYFRDIQLFTFSHNSDFDDNCPFYSNHQIWFSSDRPLGFQMLKEKSGATGRDYLNIYASQIQYDTLFQKPAALAALNQKNANSSSISFTSDGKWVYFSQNSTAASKNYAYNLQLFRAESDGKGGWKNIEKLPFCSEETNYMHPFISPDGTELFFVGMKNGNGTDIFYTRLQANGTWKPVEALPSHINTTASEAFPSVDRAGRLYFASKGHAGYGGMDIFVTERDAIGAWTTPVNLGKPINSPFDDFSFHLFRNGTAGAFSSAREGGDDDIYFFKHKDSMQLFEPTSIVPLDSISPTKQMNEVSAIAQKATIDARTDLIAPTLQSDICTTLNYCTFAKLYENLYVLADSTAYHKDSSFLKRAYILDNIHFDGIEIVKDEVFLAQIDSLYQVLAHFPVRIQLIVHTSSKGKESENLELSKKRATKLSKVLLERGISRERLRSRGMGETQPICQGAACDAFGISAHDLNERVEIKLSFQDTKADK
jgi:peptidoglycan-associated lipoprotein